MLGGMWMGHMQSQHLALVFLSFVDVSKLELSNCHFLLQAGEKRT